MPMLQSPSSWPLGTDLYLTHYQYGIASALELEATNKKIEITSNIFPDHSGVNLEISNGTKIEKVTICRK